MVRIQSNHPLRSTNLYSCSRAELTTIFQRHGFKACHVDSIFKCLYRQGVDDSLDDLPKTLRRFVRDNFCCTLPRIKQLFSSEHDGTTKIQVELDDQSLIETVVIPERARITLCISTQVGCGQRCSFCQTGRMGLVRQLQPFEIVGQFLLARQWLNDNQSRFSRFTSANSISNIVCMGMGEPLDNLDALVDAISILSDRHGAQLAMRKISVSTIGNPIALQKLLAVYPKIRIALSVHAVDSKLRAKIIPSERKWPLDESLRILADHRYLLVQYTLLNGVNDSIDDAQALIKLLAPTEAKVNLIVYNPIRDGRFTATSVAQIKTFQHQLLQGGIRATVRYSKGNDIEAACGQLFA